jgi:VWFA-related protein
MISLPGKAAVSFTLALSLSGPSFGQQVQKHPDEGRIRVVVDAVSVDVIVTNKKGKHVTDLKSEEFEVFQGGELQEITNFMYIVAQPPAAEKTPPQQSRETAQAPTSSQLRPGDVRRSMGIIVDDLGMSFRSMAYVRDALKEFIDEQIQSSDLVSISMTGSRMGGLQQFTMDKRRLHAAADRLRWNPLRRASSFDRGFFERTAASDPRGTAAYERGIAIGTLGTLRFAIEGMKELPGRKSVILFSEGFRLWYSEMEGMMGSSYMMTETVRQVNEAAHRAGVVIYTVDPRGLEPGGLTALDDISPVIAARQAEVETTENATDAGTTGVPGTLRTASINEMDPEALDPVQEAIRVRMSQYNETKQGLNYLPQATGGLFLHIGNDLNLLLDEVLEDQKGYYLIGYAPDPESIRSEGKRRFPRISVRLKKEGLRVRTRSSFLGSLEEEETELSPQDVMARALTSPFGANEVALDLTSLYEFSPETGSSVSSWLHISPEKVTFKREKDGWQTASLDVWAATFDTEDEPVDERRKTFTIRAKGEMLERIHQDGLAYRVNIPVKKPGPYQLCIVVRDTASDRIGSATQFIEVPDIDKGQLALSGMVILGTTQEDQKQSDNAPPASMSVREFQPGMQLNYALYIYNASIDEKRRRPQLETQVRLFYAGREIYAGQVHPYEPGLDVSEGPLLASGHLQLVESMPAGEYLLKYTVTDRLAKGEYRSASQWMDFAIVN